MNEEPSKASNALDPEDGRMRKNKNHMASVKIRQLDFGYVVEVGCQTFAIESKDAILTALAKYMENPREVEKNWYENKTF